MRVFAIYFSLLTVFALGCNHDSERSPELSLMLAAGAGEFDMVMDLLQEGADANGLGSGLPLVAALDAGHFTIADILVENGADVNIKLEDELSLLDSFISWQNETDSEVTRAKYQLAIDWLYDNGARRPPE